VRAVVNTESSCSVKCKTVLDYMSDPQLLGRTVPRVTIVIVCRLQLKCDGTR